MENSKPLATESFSYSWLTDKIPSPPPSDSLPNNLRQTFLNDKEQNFIFDLPVSSSPSLVHADEIFSDGHIMPVYENRSNFNNTLKTSASVPSSPLYSYSYPCKGKWRRSYLKILKKCFGLVRPLIGCSRKSNRVDDLERKVCEVRSLSDSIEASPRPSSSYSVVEWCAFKKIGTSSNGLKKAKSCNNTPKASPCVSPYRSSTNGWSCDIESSIHEAILYCKRSIEK